MPDAQHTTTASGTETVTPGAGARLEFPTAEPVVRIVTLAPLCLAPLTGIAWSALTVSRTPVLCAAVTAQLLLGAIAIQLTCRYAFRPWIADATGISRGGRNPQHWPWSDISRVHMTRAAGMHPTVTATTTRGRALQLSFLPYWRHGDGSRLATLETLAEQAEALRSKATG